MDFEMQLSMAGIHPDFTHDKKPARRAVGVSRKDTIIIAMLVNVALLAVLFATASRQTQSTAHAKLEPIVAHFETVSHADKTAAKETKTRFGVSLESSLEAPLAESKVKEPIDEIDEILKSYALKNSQQQNAKQASIQQEKATPASSKELSPIASGVKSSITANSAIASSHFVEVKVKKGDVLSRIARQHNVKVEDIIVLNNLESANVKIGQILKVPSVKSSTPSQKASQEQIPEYYIVKDGDSPWKIAKKCRIGVEDLLRLNNLNEEKARNLKIGQKLRIR